MSWTEDFVRSVNHQEIEGSNIIVPCLSKVGQHCFDQNDKAFVDWLESLSEHALYKSMLAAHTENKL